VLVVKSGRQALGAKAALTHTGALAGSDAVYDAAFRRAGLLRVLDLDELFAAAETLGHLTIISGSRLAILTNGGGIGVLAVDRLADLGGQLAGISPPAMARLDAVLPPIWSRANPIDIAGDADEARYAAALEPLLDDGENDAVLVMNVPTALASAAAAAKSIVAVTERHRQKRVAAKPVFAMWIGGGGSSSAAFAAAGIPSYATESSAIAGFMHLVRYRETRDLLMATPPSMPQDFVPDTAAVRPVIDGVLRDREPGSTRSRWLVFSPPTAFRSRLRPWRPAPRKRSRRPSLTSPPARRSSSRFNLPTSCTSRRSAAFASTSPASTRCTRRPRIFSIGRGRKNPVREFPGSPSSP
jgi:acetyltransferase